MLPWILLLQCSVILMHMSSGQIRSSHYDTQFYMKRNYSGSSANVSYLLDSLLHGYDKRLRPNYKSDFTTRRGPPVDVQISMHITGISAVSEVDMEFTVDMYFRQFWKDSRLDFSDSPYEQDNLVFGEEMLSKVWWPDTFFANAKRVKFHEATIKNAFLRISPQGEMTQSLKLTVTSMCNMDLTLFPMDSQTCSIEIESYAYSTHDIHYTWLENAVQFEQIHLPQFRLVGAHTVSKMATTSTGNYSRLGVNFLFERSLGYYLIQIYVPSSLIVALSWVSFWLSKDDMTDRVALGITTVLTMTALVCSTNSSLPKLSYMKSMDVFFTFCLTSVFMSVIEYAVVSYIKTRNKENSDLMTSSQEKPKENRDSAFTYQLERATAQQKASMPFDEEEWSLTPDKIDSYARVVFPLVFVIFNILYWLTCAYLTEVQRQTFGIDGTNINI